MTVVVDWKPHDCHHDMNGDGDDEHMEGHQGHDNDHDKMDSVNEKEEHIHFLTVVLTMVRRNQQTTHLANNTNFRRNVQTDSNTK